MRGKRLVGVAALALAVAAGVGGPAHAAVGPNPAAAAAGTDGFEVVSKFGDTDNTPIVVSCPDGKKVIGGGVRPDSVPVIVDATWPSEGNKWVGAADQQPGHPEGEIEVYAVCVTA